MMDKEQRAHDLAMQVVSELLSRDFEPFCNSDDDSTEIRETFATNVLENYTYFFEKFKNSMK